MTWRDRIACATDDGSFNEDFAVSRNDQEHAPWVKRALAICATCPVRAECEADMLTWPDAPYRVVIAGMRPRQARRYWYETNDVATVDRSNNFKGTGGHCGTRQGYQKHMRRSETPCQPCRDAHNAANRIWRKMA